MTLDEEVSYTLNNFDTMNSKNILHTLKKIQNTMQSNITKEYLEGKLQTIQNSSSEDEKKSLCVNLKPYFNWYLEKS